MEECLKDDERIKRARDRVTEYAAERIREDDEKRRRSEPTVREETVGPREEPDTVERNEPSSSSTDTRKRGREANDVLEKKDVQEEGGGGKSRPEAECKRRRDGGNE